jgi:hypothetical protein
MFASCCWFQNYKTFDIVFTTTVPCYAQYIREFYCSDFQVINAEKKRCIKYGTDNAYILQQWL